MKKKTLHPSPMEYRVIYKRKSFVEESTQYYSVFHSSEALDFLAHTLQRGQIDSSSLQILGVEEFNRFRNKWEDRLQPALNHCTSAQLRRTGDEIWLHKTA